MFLIVVVFGGLALLVFALLAPNPLPITVEVGRVGDRRALFCNYDYTVIWSFPCKFTMFTDIAIGLV
jgi:hypothetical protein